MLIKLQPDQISLFWDLIREGMIKSYKVPEKFQQDFSISTLRQFLTGDTQCWMGYEEVDGTKYAQYFVATQIVEEKYLGLKTLYIVGFNSIKPVTDEMLEMLRKEIEPYAISNGCNAVMADYTDDRIKDILLSLGFTPYKSTARLFLGGN